MLCPELDSARAFSKYLSDRWHAMCGLSWRLHTDLASGSSTGLCSLFGVVLSEIETVWMRDISCEVIVHHVMICGL